MNPWKVLFALVPLAAACAPSESGSDSEIAAGRNTTSRRDSVLALPRADTVRRPPRQPVPVTRPDTIGARPRGPAQQPVVTTARPTAAVSAPAFEAIGRGLELFDGNVQTKAGVVRITIVRVGLPSPGIAIVGAESPKAGGHALPTYHKLHGAPIVLSGGFVKSFYPPIPAGFVQLEGVALNRRTTDPILNGLLRTRGGRVSIVAFEDAKQADGWSGALQAGPLLLADGKSVLPDRSDEITRQMIEEKYARAFVALDEGGRALLGLTGPLSLGPLADYLLGALNIRDALNLSGHSNAGLFLATGDRTLQVGDMSTILPTAIVVNQQP